MTKFLDVVCGCLLHDIGKISGRAGFRPSDLQDVESSNRKAHGNNGADFLQEIISTRAKDTGLSSDLDEHKALIDSVRLHMSRERQSFYRSGGEIASNHILWLVDKADNIAAGVDRREDFIDVDDFSEEVVMQRNQPNWQKKITLRDVFDVFKTPEDGTTSSEKWFKPQMLNDKCELEFSSDDQGFDFASVDYEQIFNRVKEHLQAIDFQEQRDVPSLLSLLEATCSFVPSSTNANEVADISLYDHSKLTAAFGSAMYHYANASKIEDLHNWTHSSDFIEQEVFRLVSLDLSGIQDFIYTIASSVTGADQRPVSSQLRARSFYLELMTEHLVDELLEFLNLTRANLLYLGGGHAYLIVQNTEDAKSKLQSFEEMVNEFFLSEFDVALYIAVGSTPFSAKTVTRGYAGDGYEYNPEAYRALYKTVSEQISDKKLHRYTVSQIDALNSSDVKDGRECKVCHRIGKNSEHEMCKVCNGLHKLSSYVQGDPRGKNNGWFIVTTNPGERILELPSIVTAPKTTAQGEKFHSTEESSSETCLEIGSETNGARKYIDFIGGKYQAIEELQQHENDGDYIRLYAKNKFVRGENQGTRILVGDYTARNLASRVREDESMGSQGELISSRAGKAISFEKMAKEAVGIDRIAVLRADVDDLGAAFMSGFAKQGSPHGIYNTMSRSATFSRSMSLFFKYHLNWMLAHPREGVLTSRSSQDFLHLSETYGGRLAQVVYSGGDDLFIVGAWNDVIEFALELNADFKKWTNGKLTLSAGIGLFSGKASISRMAKQTGELESTAKEHGKNSVALFSEGNTFKWNEFTEQVMGEKFKTVQDFFAISDISERSKGGNDEYGKAFIYKLLGLLRETDRLQTGDFTVISMAHWVYFLTRMEPKGGDQEKLAKFREFTAKLNEWINSKSDRKELEVALELYVYTIRNSDERQAK